MATSDKMTRDIMARVKKSVGVVPRYASGTARLFLASGAEFFKNEMPAPVAMVQTNQELLSDAVRFLRNPVDAINKQVDRALGSDDFKALQRFAKNALDDLKTGNLYDPVRDRSELGMQIDADLANFGGIDLDNFDENGDWMEDSGSGSDDGIAIEIAKIQDKNDSKRTSATIDAIGASTNAIVSTNNSNSQMNLRMSIKQHSQQMQAMENMITAQTSTFELINKSMQASMNVTREAHNQMIGKLDEITGLLQKIAEGVSPAPDKKEYKEQEDIFGYNGELNIKQYLKRVVQNVDDKYAVKSMMSNLTMGMGVKGLLELVQDNPWTLVSSKIIDKLAQEITLKNGESLQKQMQRTNKNMESFIPALLQKLGERGRLFDEGKSDKFSDMIAGLFGVTPRSRASIDTAYENPVKQAQFTAKTARAIEEVIPMWLARIDSHISGGPLMVYNYKTGKLENAGKVVSTYEHSTRDLVGRMGESASEILDRAAMYRFDNSDDQKKFLNFVYRYLQKQGEENRFINPYLSPDDFKSTMPDSDNRDFYYNLLSGILTTMPRDKIMQASRDILGARQSRDKNTYSTNNDLKDSGLIAAWSGFMDQSLQSRLTSETNKTRSGLTDIEIDNISKELHDKVVQQGGTQATNVLLTDIVRTLRNGIITYSYNIGKVKAIDKLPEQVKKRVLKIEEAADTQYKNDKKVAEQLDSYQLNHAKMIEGQKKLAEDERKLLISDEAKMFVSSTNTSAFDAAQIQAAINYSSDKKADPDNPAVARHRQVLMEEVSKLNGTRDKVLEKTGVNKAMTFLRTAAEEPFRLFGEGLRLTDAFMFKMLFGEDAASNLEMNGEPYLLQTLTHSLNVHFKNATDWFAEHVGNPVKKYLLDDKVGILPRIGQTLKETLGWDDTKSKLKTGINRFKERMIGIRDVDADGKPIGDYKGGRFSSTVNKFRSFGDSIESRISGAVTHLLYGDYSDGKRKGVGHQLVQTGTRRVKGSRMTRNGMVEYEEDVPIWSDQLVYGGVIGKLRQGFDGLQNFLFGDDDSREKWDKVKRNVNEALPNIVIGGGAGMLASIFLPGGPILGGLIGSGLGLIKGSEDLKKFLFGESIEETVRDENGNPIIDPTTGEVKKRHSRKGNLISKEVYDGFKQYAPKMTAGAIAGAVAGGLGLLPFGMSSMAGTVIGSIGGMLGASDSIKKMIFGDGVDPESGLISKNFKDKVKDQVKRYAPASIAGALTGAGAWGLVESIGLIPGLSLIPGGPIFSMLGGLVGMSNADKFNQFLFGEEVETEEDVTDANGNVTGKKKKKTREGGVFGKVFDFARDKMLTPLAKRVDSVGKNIGKWFHKDILGPLDRAIKPLKDNLIDAGARIRDSLLNIGDHITRGILSAFNVEIGGTLNGFFTEKVIPRFKETTDRFFNAIGKIIGGIISAPFKALEFMVTGAIREPSDPRAEADKERSREKTSKRAERAGRHMGKNAKHTGGHLKNFLNRVSNFFGFGKDDFSDSVADQVGPTIADNQIIDKNGRVRGRSNTVTTPNVIQLGPSGPSIATTTGSNGETKVSPATDDTKTSTVTDSERKDKDTEESDAERNRKRNKFTKRRSDNSYLAEIASHTRSIKNEIKGQLGGTGWNIAYIKTLLELQYGPLSDDQLPEEMEGSKKVKKKRNIFGRMFDRASDLFDIGKEKVGNFFGGAGRRAKAIGRGVGGFFRVIFHPLQFLGKMLELLASSIGTVAKGLLGAVKFIGKGLAGALEVGGKFIKGAAEGLGKALGNTLELVTGAITDIALAFTATARGLVEFVADTMPEVARLAIRGIGAVGKGLFNGAKAIGKGLGRGISAAGSWIKNKVTGKKESSITDRIRNIGSFTVAGGFIDKVGETVIRVGNPLDPVDFPIITLLRGHPQSPVVHAVPVYVAGSATDSGKSGSRDARFKAAYQKADRAAESSSDPGAAYDKAVANAKTADEIQAIALASQMNANKPLMLTDGKEEKSGLLDTFASFFKNGAGGVASKIAALLGGTALGGTIINILTNGKAIAGAAGNTALSAAPGAIGAVNAVANGEYGHAAAYAGRGAISALRTILKAGTSKSPVILQKANMAVATAALKAPNKLSAFIKSAVSKFLTNKTVKSFLIKLKIDPNRIVSAISGNLDNACASLMKETAEQLLKKANLVILIATAVYDFTSGMLNANQYFAVSASDTTFGMRVAAGLAKGISGIAFGLIPVGWLASTLYKLCATAESKQELEESQNAYKERVAAYNAANNTDFTPEQFAKTFNEDGTERKGLFKTITGWFTGGSSKATDASYGYGRGRMKTFTQTSARWNRSDASMHDTGCGPTVAAMVESAYGRNSTPLDANRATYQMGMREADGSTNPNFFTKYAAGKNYGMERGPTSSGMIQSNLAKGHPVVLMGKGGDFGPEMHYLVADRAVGKGKVSIKDPYTGATKLTNIGNLVRNTASTIYSYGKGPGTTNNANAQNALVDAMSSIQGKIAYSLEGNKQDPDKGAASCASTVGWAYRKVLGGDFVTNPMSAGSTIQSSDNRFKTIWVNTGGNTLDTTMLQPGDVMYFNWNQTKYNGKMQHTEMYAGNDQDWSHGGRPFYGPVLKDLTAKRKRNLMMVRRYAPFVDGNTVTYNNVDLTTIGAANNGSNDVAVTGDTLYDKAFGFISNVGSKYDSFISRLFGAKDEVNEDGTTDEKSNNVNGINSSTNSANIAGTSTGAKIWNYLIGKGLTKTQVAGIMGNLYAESLLRPDNLQDSYEKSLGYSDSSYTNAVNSGTYKNFANDRAGYGLAQWTTDGRKAGLLASAQSSGKNIDDLGLQLDYLWNELNGSFKNSVLDPIRNTTTVRDATKIFLQKFEVPKDYDKEWKIDSRTSYSNNMLTTYGTGPRKKDLSPLPQLTSWGTGGGNVSTNLSNLNERIRRINHTITKTREEAAKAETATQITTAITDAVGKATNSDQSVSQVLQVLSASLSTMIQLLSDIKTNTTPKDDDSNNRSTSSGSKLPSVRADHFDSDTGVGTNSNNIGASIIDALTSK